MDALVIGGTRFLGRGVVEEFRDAGYDVAIFNRGEHDKPFGDEVDHVEGDRTDEGRLRQADEEVTPDVVVDCVAYHPADVRAATEIFSHADAYVYVSSGAAYGREDVPKREGETPLEPCTADQATDDGRDTYGNRKAEGDRAVFSAAEDGVSAMSVRPPVIYGPHDYTERFDYWIDRVDNHDRVIVPGDGTNLWHLAYVEDVASAIRTVAEEGTPGEAYNVGDDHSPPLGQWVEMLADACDTDVDPVYASARELSTVGVDPTDFPIYREFPHLLDTTKLRSLSWRSTDHETALSATVADHRDSDRTGRAHGPDREDEQRLLDVLDTV